MPIVSKAQREATVFEKAYLAGLFDGEGCVGAVKVRDKRGGRAEAIMFTAVVSMCDREPIDLLAEIYGGAIRSRKTAQKAHHSRVFTWQAYGDAGAKFLRDVLPYLRVKRGQAEAYLRARTTFTGWGRRPPSPGDMDLRFACYNEIRRLNGRHRHAAGQ